MASTVLTASGCLGPHVATGTVLVVEPAKESDPAEPSAEPLRPPSAFHGLWPDPGVARAGPGDRPIVAPRDGEVVYYVRPGGGTPGQCTGRVDADYPGTGERRPCALAHPFFLLPPAGGEARLRGGEVVVIRPGEYRVGPGAPGAARCGAKGAPPGCELAPVPSGLSPDRPTRILGAGWDSGCSAPPTLSGVGGIGRVLGLEGSSHVQVACLELTDRSACVAGHTGGHSCKDRPGEGWAAYGVRAHDSRHVTLRYLDIHGLADGGVLAGRLEDWTLEDVRIAGNGWVGWNGDLGEKGSANRGRMAFRRVTIAYNGCAETFPEGKPTGCWAQSAGGYGDGMGTGETGGDWLLEDCRVTSNTSDGIDLLYHTLGGEVVVRRMLAEGNAGNALKTAGNTLVESSLLTGNCGAFDRKPHTHRVDHCRAGGNTLALALTPGARATVLSSTLYGEGDALITVGPRGQEACSGGEALELRNNVFMGDQEFGHSKDWAGLLHVEGCPGLTIEAGHNLADTVKGRCNLGEGDVCEAALLNGWVEGRFDPTPRSGSPAIDSATGLHPKQGPLDLARNPRVQGQAMDRGAMEPPPAPTP